MYKEPLLNDANNAIMKKVIELEMANKTKKVADESQTDAAFLVNLHDLCVLNKMAESHQEPKLPPLQKH